MKTINETFTDEEYIILRETKDRLGLSWHDYIMLPREKKLRVKK